MQPLTYHIDVLLTFMKIYCTIINSETTLNYHAVNLTKLLPANVRF